MTYTSTQLIRDVQALLAQRGLTAEIRVADLPLAHAAALTLLQTMGVLPWTPLTDPRNVDLREVER